MTNAVENYELGDVVLQSGLTLRGASLAYKTFGELNANRDNVIVFPTFFGSNHTGNEPMIGEGMALDPSRYFVIVPDLFGNGMSSSPSNTPQPYDRARFPKVTYYDNITFQHRLVTEHFGVERIALVCGFSMGAQQTFHWGALHPDVVERIAPWCGSAKTSRHNFVFLEGVKAALTADDAWNNGWYDQQPTKGMQAAARVYAGWGPSQAFYREKVYLEMGFSSVEDYLITGWEGRFRETDANDFLAMINTWQNGDISNNPIYDGDFEATLGSIKAKAIVMPSQTDQYFPPEDNEIEVSHMPNAELRVIPSIWGHLAGGPGRNPADTQFIDDALKELLASGT
jgi:homoserine O-acetyltransferase